MAARKTFNVDADLALDICRLIRSRAGGPMAGVCTLVASMWIIKGMFMSDATDKEFVAIVADLMSEPPRFQVC